MGQLQKDLKTIEDAGIRVVAISYDPVETLKRFTDKYGITYTMLSDPGSKTIDAYGIRNTEVTPGSRQDGIPYPGTFLVDRHGVIRAKLFKTGYVDRHSTAELLEAAAVIDE